MNSLLVRPAVGAALVAALAACYEANSPAGSALHEFQQSGAKYLFDLASVARLPQEDRTAAAWALTPTPVVKRDTAYQRGFLLSPRADGSTADRGHVVGREGLPAQVRAWREPLRATSLP